MNMPLPTPYDVLILGSGPAGWTAAIYAARAGLKTLVFTGYQAGGQLMLTSEIENYPGFAEGIPGPTLMAQMRQQALRFGAELVEADVTRVDFTRQPLTAFVEETAYQGKTVIIATGASARWLGLDSEARLRGQGVSACATCDGFFFRGKALAVVGGGDTALEEALYLTRYASKVTVVHRRDRLRASKIMQQRALAHPKLAWVWNQEVLEVLGAEAVEGLKLRNTVTGEESVLGVGGLFVAIGHQPNTGLFEGQLDQDEHGYLLTTHHSATSVPGVFVAGDVRDRRYRQAVTAAGAGAMAALDAEAYLTASLGSTQAVAEEQTNQSDAGQRLLAVA
jgi:thioredoxin reductase (NADPH)